ncbi:MAG: O-antigen ligase family protein [Chloroflexota bacterium]
MVAVIRRWIIFAVALIALCGSITTVFATQAWRDYELRGYVDPTQTVDLPYRVPRRLGVNADLFQYDDDELTRHLGLMREANIVWVRQVVYWDTFEPTQGTFEWDALDRVMGALDAYPEIELIPVFMNSPAWARESDVVTAPPDDPVAISPFLQAFTERYGEAIDYYQVWDEPNLDDAWGLRDPRPAEYVALLAEAYRAIHGTDSNATVIAAALAPTTEERGQNIADDLYLQVMYDLEADDYFDAVAAKPYGFSSAPLNRDVGRETLNFSRLVLLREVMLANGDGQTALWASNWGWNHLPDSWAGEASIWGSVSAEEQIRYTAQAFDRVEREWAWAGGLLLHHWQPNVLSDDAQWGFALIGQDGEPTALYDALVNYEWASTASNGVYHPRTDYAEYSGVWTFSALGADIGWLETSDSQLSFNFYGTDIALRVREDDYFAFLYPQVNGEMANATPEDADGNAYILLRSGSQTPELSTVAVSRNLSLDTHTLTVVADRGEDRWALAGYAVSSGDLSAPFTRQLTLAWVTVLCSMLAVFVSAVRLPFGDMYVRMETWYGRIHTGVQFGISVATSLALMVGMLMTWGAPTPQLFRREMIDAWALMVLTGGLLVIELPLLLSLVSVLVLFWIIYHRIAWGLMLTLFYAPFFLFPVELYRFAFPMAEMLLLITFGAWLLRTFVMWGKARQMTTTAFSTIRLHWHALDGMIGLWVLLGVIAVFGSEIRGLALTELRVLFIEPALFYMMLRSCQPDWRLIRQFVWVLIGSAVLVAMIGIVLYVQGEGIITAEGGARRLASVYGSPNNVGLLMGRVIPFVLAFVSLRKDSLRYVYSGVLILLLITVALTQSVGALLIGVPVGIVTVLLLVYRQKAIPYVIGLIVVGLVATAGLTQVSTRFASLLDLSTGTNFIRIRVWESTLEILQDNPVMGLGLDQFLYVFSDAYVRPDAIFDPDLSHPHNIVLDFWIRLGVLGVGWLGLFMWLMIRDISCRLSHFQVARDGYAVYVGMVGALVAVFAHGMIDNSIYVIDLAFIFVFLVAILTVNHTDAV